MRVKVDCLCIYEMCEKIMSDIGEDESRDAQSDAESEGQVESVYQGSVVGSVASESNSEDDSDDSQSGATEETDPIIPSNAYLARMTVPMLLKSLLMQVQQLGISRGK
jgi:hypothetical protein